MAAPPSGQRGRTPSSRCRTKQETPRKRSGSQSHAYPPAGRPVRSGVPGGFRPSPTTLPPIGVEDGPVKEPHDQNLRIQSASKIRGPIRRHWLPPSVQLLPQTPVHYHLRVLDGLFKRVGRDADPISHQPGNPSSLPRSHCPHPPASGRPPASDSKEGVPSLSLNGFLDPLSVPDFTEKCYQALIRAADQCAVKRHMENPRGSTCRRKSLPCLVGAFLCRIPPGTGQGASGDDPLLRGLSKSTGRTIPLDNHILIIKI